MSDLLTRLAALQVSTVCDADKSLVPLDAGIRRLAGPARMAGTATTVIAVGDHLAPLVAVTSAAPGSVLVIASGGTRAVLGGLFATEAARRGLAGIVVDGFVRDLRDLRDSGVPVWARGTYPASGTAVTAPDPPGAVVCGGVRVADGDLVLADDDGLLAAPVPRLSAVVDTAEAIEAAEARMLAAMAEGHGLEELTNVRAHVAALRRGEASALAFEV